MNRRVLSAIATAIGATFFFTACAGGAGAADYVPAPAPVVSEETTAAPAAPEADTLIPRGHLNMALMQGIQGWDVDDFFGAQLLPAFTAVFDTILRADDAGGVAPGVAHTWEYNSDRTELTLHLVEGIYFTDGTALDAEAVAANLIRFRESAGSRSHDAAAIVDAVATASYTVVITLDGPDPLFLANLSRPMGMISSPASWDNPDVGTNPVGSGPYILDTNATIVGSTYVFRYNPTYWDNSWQRFESVAFTVFQDATALMNAAVGGQLDALQFFGDLGNLAQLEANGFNVSSIGLDAYGILILDRDGVTNPELADVRVRQAMNYAIDSEGLILGIQQGRAVQTGSMFGPATQGFLPELNDRFEFNPDRARELLAEAGVENLTINWVLLPNSNMALYTQMQQMLANVGINVEFEVTQGFFADLRSLNFPLVALGLNSSSDVAQIGYTIAPNALFNIFQTQRDNVDEWIHTIRTGSPAEATAAAQELNRYVTEEAWFVPMYLPFVNFLYNDNLTVVRPMDTSAPGMYQISPR